MKKSYSVRPGGVAQEQVDFAEFQTSQCYLMRSYLTNKETDKQTNKPVLWNIIDAQ